MKVRKIQNIKHYKSFSDFSWCDFCKDRSNNEKTFSGFSLVFGENGSGKSSICDILKNLSQIQDFPNTPPESAEIEIENNDKQSYKFENGNWSPNKLDKNSFLFFDVDFINANVHTHGDRSNQQGRHSQNSGKMIIDLDDKANQLKTAIQEKKQKIENFEESNSNILNKTFSDNDKSLFVKYKDKKDQEIKEEISKNQQSIKKIDTELLSLQNINKKYSQISQISTIPHLSLDLSIAKKEIYTEIFSREIKEKSQNQADEKIKAHFEKHKYFIEQAKDKIPQDYKKEDCPLCMQPLSNASKFIEYYRIAFDQTYENEKRKFLSNIESLKNELGNLKSNFGNLPTKTSNIFDSFEKIKTNFEIDIYDVDEKTTHTKLTFPPK